MNIDLRKICRICFVDNADIDINNHRVVTTGQTNDADEEELTICEIMQTMFNPLSLDLMTELPMICNACLEECLVHYAYYSKLMVANQQLRELYNGAQLELNEREPILEDVEKLLGKDTHQIEQHPLPAQQFPEMVPIEALPTLGRLASEDSLIVSEFLPASEPDEQRTDSEQKQLRYPELRTLDYAAVELRHDSLDDYNEANRLLNTEPSGSQAVYKCKYCPLAYASQQFLKTHVRRSHVCKYCTTAFVKVKDLNAHIRDTHANSHQCVVCSNSFSTSSNLRAHLKRMHGVQLPAQVALLDYRPAPREATQDYENATN